MTRRFSTDETAKGEGATFLVILLGLVAAIGAGALIMWLATDLRDNSASRVDDAMQAQSGPFQILEAVATVSGGDITRVDLFVAVSPAAETSDLSAITLTLNTGHSTATFGHTIDLGQRAWTFEAERDTDGSVKPGQPILNAGDLVKITLGTAAAGMNWPAGAAGELVQTAGNTVVDATLSGGSGRDGFVRLDVE